MGRAKRIAEHPEARHRLRDGCQVFLDPDRKMFTDSKHNAVEPRLFCIGKVDGKIVTVRFVHRHNKVRIFGAGYWRKGATYYEEKN